MPLLKIQTNMKLDQPNQDELIRECSGLMAKLLKKPERYVMVILECGVNMCFNADTAAACYVECKSIGLPENQTTDFSAVLSDHLGNKTGVLKDRIYIEFTNAERHLWGWNGTTF